jgi:hypothetical protein
MSAPIELLLVAMLLTLLRIARSALRNAKRQQGSNASGAEAPALSPESAPTRMRGVATAAGPTRVRDVEERLPTIDEHGNRVTVIRIRTLETFLGRAGPTEIELHRRHTLPGHGHVSQRSDTEFTVFRSGVTLRLDVAATRFRGSGGLAPRRKPYEVSPAPRSYRRPRPANTAHRGATLHTEELEPVGPPPE